MSATKERLNPDMVLVPWRERPLATASATTDSNIGRTSSDPFAHDIGAATTDSKGHEHIGRIDDALSDIARRLDALDAQPPM